METEEEEEGPEDADVNPGQSALSRYMDWVMSLRRPR